MTFFKGHCVFLEGEFHTDWVFVPQYYNGSAPHGVWVANKVMIFDEWKSQHMGRDVAFAITDKKNGKSLSEVVGYLEAAACDPDNSEKITGSLKHKNYSKFSNWISNARLRCRKNG